MDESNDWTDTEQLSIFIRVTDENFIATEEVIGLCSMVGRVTEKETAYKVIKCVTEKLGLTFDNLMAVCTDGAPSVRIKNVSEATVV